MTADLIADLQQRLRDVPGRGTFEAHVTVEADDLAERERFRGLCSALDVKCVLIELPHGQTRSQPMSASYHRGDAADAGREVARLATAMADAGFTVVRVKIEAVITNTGLPRTDAEAATFPASNYFEFHVKALLGPGADLDALRAVCDSHAAHLSSNALKRDTAGQSERFVTLRAYGVGRVTAEARFEALTDALTRAGFELGGRLREYAIYDSNVGVDAGWIDAPEDE